LLNGLRAIWSRKVLVLSILGYVFNTFALGGVAGFVIRYGTGLGMSMVESQWNFGIVLVVTGILGTFFGGMIASKFASRAASPTESLLRFVSISTLIGTPFLIATFLVGTPTLFLASCFIAELAAFAGVAPINSVIVTKSPSGLETLVQALTIFAIQLFGTSFASFAIGYLADYLLSVQFGGGSEASCLGVAMQLSSFALFLSGVTWFFAARVEGATRSA